MSPETRPHPDPATLTEPEPLADVVLVATDLDGTLLGETSTISERAVRAIAAARGAGIHVVPVTGRPPMSVWALAESGGLGPLGVCSNGGIVVDLESNQILEMEPIEGPVAGELIEIVRTARPGVLFALDDMEKFCFEPSFIPEGRTRSGRAREVSDIGEMAADGCVKLIARHPGTDAVTLMRHLQDHIGDAAHVTSSGLDWVEIMAPGVSKANAVARVCRRLGIDRAQVVAIGDNYNDLPLLDWAGPGHAMAPANAVDAILEVVGRVLPTNIEDGVAVLLEELVALRG
ncbi:MAG: Cof-type HAD-IIB family hydrolase [Acidimicrobiaceae bacterium]|nr:Cof-type HAD-IIB family hydrolase [Acidimicrobiaceae bacterium]